MTMYTWLFSDDKSSPDTLLGTCKVGNEIETKRNRTKQNEIKQNEMKPIETKRNVTSFRFDRFRFVRFRFVSHFTGTLNLQVLVVIPI